MAWRRPELADAGNLDLVGRILQQVYLYPEIQARIADVPSARGAFADLVSAAAPRAHLRRPLRRDEPANVFQLEEGPGPTSAAALRALGWSVEVNADREAFGGLCAVEIAADGRLVGVADLRRTNAARGY